MEEDHKHTWEADTFWVDRCIECGQTESIFVEGHYENEKKVAK